MRTRNEIEKELAEQRPHALPCGDDLDGYMNDDCIHAVTVVNLLERLLDEPDHASKIQQWERSCANYHSWGDDRVDMEYSATEYVIYWWHNNR